MEMDTVISKGTFYLYQQFTPQIHALGRTFVPLFTIITWKSSSDSDKSGQNSD
jgi:hypothetical protein